MAGRRPTERFLDTNILLRHLTGDDPVQSPAALALVRSIEAGQESVWTTPLVVAELVFVLSNKKTYGLDRARIRDLLLPLISLAHVRLPNKQLYSRVFELYVARPIDYVDAYHAALVERRRPAELYSYDRDFDHVPSVTRIEPALAPGAHQVDAAAAPRPDHL